jgi:hypothetical protein
MWLEDGIVYWDVRTAHKSERHNQLVVTDAPCEV